MPLLSIGFEKRMSFFSFEYSSFLFGNCTLFRRARCGQTMRFYGIADAIIFTYISKSVYISSNITRSNRLYIFLHIIRTLSIFPINYQYAFFYTYVFVNIVLYMDVHDFYLYAVRRFLENIDRHCLESWTSLLFSSLHVPL